MTKERVFEIVNRIDVSGFPFKPGHKLGLICDDRGVVAMIYTTDARKKGTGIPGDEWEMPEGLCPGYATQHIKIDFDTATESSIFAAVEATLADILRHELREHMRFEGQMVFNPHPEVQSYLDELNATGMNSSGPLPIHA
jgi:hypothetical protein